MSFPTNVGSVVQLNSFLRIVPFKSANGDERAHVSMHVGVSARAFGSSHFWRGRVTDGRLKIKKDAFAHHQSASKINATFSHVVYA